MLVYFLLTQIIEIPILLWLLRERDWRYTATVMFLVNTITWPVATLLFQHTSMTIWTLEGIVIVMEMLLFILVFNLPWHKALLYAFIINAVSTAAGFLIPGHYAGRL